MRVRTNIAQIIQKRTYDNVLKEGLTRLSNEYRNKATIPIISIARKIRRFVQAFLKLFFIIVSSVSM